MTQVGTHRPPQPTYVAKFLLTALSIIAFGYATVAQTINTANPTNAYFCSGSDVTVTASSWSGLGSGTHNVQVQLSDASGSFTSPTVLTTGTLSGSSGSNSTFNVTIPNVALGSGYRVRVIRVSPSSTANASSAFSIAEAYNTTFLVNETMGTGTSTNPGSYSGYTHNGTYTYSGSGSSIVTSNASPGSGSSSVLLDNNSETWQISGINTSSSNLVQLSFRIRKSSTSESGSNLAVEFSTNGTSYSSVAWSSLPTGSGTSGWYTRTAATFLPATSNLRIRFTRTGGSSNWQIDDVQVASGVATAVSISPSTTQNICSSSPVTIAATVLSNAEYLWSNDETTSSITTNLADNYDVEITDYFGCTPTRGPVAIAVSPASVGGSVSGTTSVCTGSNSGTLTLSGHTGSITRWQSSTNGGTSWNDIANTTTTQAYSNITTATLYRAVVTSGTCASANSSNVTISVNPVSVGGTASGAATVCQGSNSGTVTLSGHTGTVTRWQSSTNGGSTWNDIANTNTSLSYTNLSTTTQYRAVVTSSPCSSANSTVVTITVNPTSVGGTTSASASVCSGINTGTITLSGNTGTVTRWQSSTNGGSTWNDIANTTNSQTYTDLTSTTLYRAVVTSGVCSSANSSVSTITVNPFVAPSVNISSASTTICQGELVSFTATPTNGGASPSYQWRKNGNNVGTNSSTYSDFTLVTGDAISCIMTSNAECASPTSATSNTLTMTVNPYAQASVSIATSANGICNGTAVTFTATPTNGGTTPAYQWKLNGANVGTNSTTFSSSSLNNGDIVTVEMTSNYSCLIPNAEIDPNWPSVQPNGGLYTTKVQSDGKILVGGLFSQIGSTGRSRIARYNVNGTLDTSFNPGGGVAAPGSEWVSDIEVQSDGKIIIVGNFDTYNGTSRGNIVRVNSNGSIDTSFDPGSGTNGDVYTVKLQSDGKMIIVGPFSSFDGTTTRGIARLNADGSLDSSYSPDMNNGATGWDVAIQQDGKAVVVGDFTSIDGTGRNRVARINTNGTLDTSFNPGSGANGTVNSVDIQNDGDIIIGGDFTSYNGTTRNRVTRINPNGTIETAFIVPGGANNNVYDVLAHPSNRSYFAGSFDTFGGNTATGLARTTASGSYDSTFDTNNADVNTTWCLELNAQQELFVSGEFTNAFNTTKDYLVKIRSNVVTGNTITMNVSAPSVGGTIAGTTPVCNGANGNLTLSGNTGSVVRWQSSTNGGSSWSDIANTTNTLSYTNISTTTQYRAVVQNGSCSAVNSNTFTLSVDAPTVAGTVTTSTNVCTGTNSGTVNLSGQTGSVLNWQRSTDNGANWINITNTSTSLNFSNITATTQYRAVVRNGVCTSANSSPATITVNPLSVGGSTSGTTSVCATSNSGSISLSGFTGTVTRWQSSTNGGTSWNDITNTSSTNAYSNLSVTTQFRAVVTSGACSSANSTITTITVNPTTVAGSVVGNATVCAGSNSGSVSISGNTGNVTAWQFSTNGGSSWTNLLGTTPSRTYTNLSQTTLYRAQIQSGVCAAEWSLPATITVDPTSNGGVTSGVATVCADGNSGNITLAGNVGTVIRWQSSTNGGSTWNDIANTTSTQAYNDLTQTTVYRAVVQSGVCSSANSSTTTITVNPTTVGGTVSSDVNVCATSNSGTLALSGQTGSVIRWQFSTNGGSSWNNLLNTSVNQSYNNLSSTTMYRAEVKSGVCNNQFSVPATVTVTPAAVGGLLTGGANVCSNGNSGTLTVSGIVGTINKWQFSTNGGATWNDIANSTASQSYNNITTTTRYRVVVSNSPCSDAFSNEVVLNVISASIGGTASSSQTICAGAAPSAISLTGQTGPVIRWEFSTNDSFTSPNTIASTSSTLSSAAIGALNATAFYRAIVQQNGVGCLEASSAPVQITVNARPSATIGSDVAICPGETASLTLNVVGSGTISGTVTGGIAFSGTAPSISIDVNPNATITYSITSMSDNNCSSIASDYNSTNATVTVNPRPNGTILGNNTICLGETSDLRLNLTGTGPWTGTLSNGDTFNASSSPYIHSVSPTTSTVYTIASLSDANCVASATVSSASSVSVVVRNVTATISGSTNICSGDNATLNFAFTGAVPFVYSYTDGSTVFGPITTFLTSSSQFVSPSTAANYTLLSASDLNCNATLSGSAAIGVNTNPSVSISGESDFCASGENEEANLNAVVNPGSGSIVGYSWLFENGIISGANSSSFAASAVGSYAVTVEDSNGCIGTSASWDISLQVFNISTYTEGSGTITAATNATCGSTRLFTISATPCYYIGSVTLNGTPVDIGTEQLASYVLTVTNISEDVVVAATFNPIQLVITTQANTDDFLTATISHLGSIVRNCGSSETFNINVGPCTALQNVVVNGNSIGPQSTFTLNPISMNYDIYVILERVEYEVIASAGSGGAISPSGVNTYFCGTNPSFTVSPNPGFAIVGVTVNGNPIGALSTVTLSNLSENATIVASFAPVPTNNSFDSPANVISPNFPSCISNNYTLEGCTSSSESDDDDGVLAPIGSGQDAWFRLRVPVGSTGIMRIQANSTTNNIAIILRREGVSGPAGIVAIENSVASIGSEIMNIQGLVPGAYYRVAIKNMSLQNAGPFSICISSVRAPGCGTITSPSNGASLCDLYNTSYSGANSYTITVTNQANPSEVYVRTNNGGVNPASTLFSLASMPGLRYNAAYTVRVDATHLMANAAGTTQTMNVSGATNTCVLYTRPQPSSGLVAADQCSNGPKMMNQVVSIDWVCGAIDFEWSITPTTGLPFPYTTFRGIGDRFMRVGSLNGINSGATTFNVRVRPIFNDGAGGRRNGEWSSVSQLCIVGAAALGEVSQDEPAAAFGNRMLSIDEVNTPFVGIYPNPSNGDYFNISLENVKDEKVTMKLIDHTGKTVLVKEFAVDGAMKLRVDLGQRLASGLYTVEMNVDGKSVSQRLIIQQ